MGAKLVLEQMKGTLPVCVFCGCKPRDEEDNPYPGVTMPGVDVNWGDTPYVCRDCTAIAAELQFDIDPRKAAEIVAKLKKQLEFRNKQVEKLQTEVEEKQKRIDRMLDGAKARKEAKAEREKKS